MNFLNNIPQVTKNLLIINVLFYIATLVMMTKGVDLIQLLGAHYINSPFFEPYQIVTHFFMHSTGILHIFMNMFILVSLGSHLERIWGPKRFFIFYIASAVGAFTLYNGIGVFQIMELKHEIESLGYSISDLNYSLATDGMFQFDPADKELLMDYSRKALTPMVGASGAVFGVLAAFAFLFPNTEFMMLFIPFPIKAKYFVVGYVALEVYLGLQNSASDNVAHFAHVGGALVGFLIVLYWNKVKKDTFY
jgi:membrane associated rhomboid family serine protease